LFSNPFFFVIFFVNTSITDITGVREGGRGREGDRERGREGESERGREGERREGPFARAVAPFAQT
jgi:hypothetical protein